MKKYKILVLPGDGIGPEIMDATLEVLDSIQKLSGRFQLDYDFHSAGAGCYRKSGKVISEETLQAFQTTDATLKGPVGLPDVRKPDGTEAGLLGGVLRVDFDLWANLRPIRLFPNVRTPLAGMQPDDIDYIILRENCEGLYLSRGIGITTHQAATDTLLMTQRGCERICRHAFDLALKKRRGAPADGQKRVTLVDKSNVLKSFAFLRRIFLNIAEEYPQISNECLYMDAAAAALISRPGHFHIIVTENMFGDILSDLGGATVGGLGMCPGANIGDGLAYFEPIHGSAPDIAGKKLANPLSQIRAAAMMLDHLGRHQTAEKLETAVWNVLNESRVVINPGGSIEGGPDVMAKALLNELEKLY
jgi:3-isopropylmalate dehydrogenase